ncbi:uncharacterized protein L3040_000606 [Drepanopeziza brunnea f. sp. 'multigermtubi']|uniref:uncharacterized protein n=1 Tax=Drepanopeziza brunnea f. sp. 'multigermtubi' TaxID=698441 RepID=UPI00238E3FA7|nr:hypothetical protein L3040_000606 [Drepanopeziza brunnea f. sp. 'multigermtubi']
MDSHVKVRPKAHSKKRPTVCIVGAGISGLRCADILLKQGFDVSILEARDRIGGRVHQTPLLSGQLVDLGANWIHGTDNNPILDLVKETNTATHDWGDGFNVFDENGKFLENGKSLNETLWGFIVEAFKYSASNSTTIDPKLSLYDFFAEKIQDIFPGSEEAKQSKTLMQMAEMWGAFVGSPVQKQSLKFFWLEECIDGENLFCAGTYQKVLATIAKPALDGAKLKLSTKVTSVASGFEKVSVQTDNGYSLDFDEVVITCPLGWLKKNKAVFQPELPARFTQAADAIGYGSLEKVYVTFPRAFWLGSADYPDTKPFTGFAQWLAPQYAKDTNPKGWNQEVVDMATLPNSCAHPTLLFYLFGDQSETFATELTARPSQKERDEYLTKFFKPYYSLLPHYNAESKDCVPVQCLATTWVADDLAGNGSYTTMRTGLEDADKHIEVMREGLPGRGVWFAGEHTAPFVALGTVTGAYWSGEAVAKRIAGSYGMYEDVDS